jgi:multidrug efflux system membrane fusion protein
MTIDKITKRGQGLQQGYLAGQNRLSWKKLLILLVVVLGSAGGIFAWFHAQEEAKTAAEQNAKKAVPVTVALAETRSVPIEIRNIGNVAPFSIVNVIPQVGGQISKVCFTQGQFVKKDELLFQIDPRPYQAAVDQAEGNVAKDKGNVSSAQANLAKDIAALGQLQANMDRDLAQARYAKIEMNRYQGLVTQGAVSHEQSDQTNTNSVVAEATVQADRKTIENAKAVIEADKAAIRTALGTLEADEAVADNARVQLGWTEIRSPIDGRTGVLNVYQGNVVTLNNQTPLVSISQIQPIYVNFSVPEQYLAEVRAASKTNTLTVNALIEGQKTDIVQGDVSFVDATVNTSTGSIMLRGQFSNEDKRLWPGQYVDVIVTLPGGNDTTVIPSRAIQTSQQGQSVYVMKPDHTVDFVTVTVDRTYGEWSVISKGVSPGDTVVTDGQLQLQPGSQVTIKADSTSS